MTISTKPEDIDSPETILHYMESYPASGQNRAAAKLIRELLATAPLAATADYKTDAIKLAISLLGAAISDSNPCVLRDQCADVKDRLFAALTGQVAQTETARDKKIRAVETPADYPIEGVFGQVAPQATATDEKIDALAQEYDCAKLLRAAPARPLATPPTSKATELIEGREYFTISCNELLRMKNMSHAMGLREGLDTVLSTSKADTGEALRNAYDQILEAAAIQIEITPMLGRNKAAAVVRALKSATPSTIKAEPTGEKL